MTSYRNGKPTGLAASRPGGSSLFGPVRAVAGFANRHANTVRRYCIPTACDVNTRADLYDLEQSVRQLTMRETREIRCSIADTHGDDCGSPIMHNAPVPVCGFHAGIISAFYAKQDLVEYVRANAIRGTSGTPGGLGPTREPRSCCIYYIQVGARIKIGTSIDVKKRLAQYPPGSRLLATEPGSYDTEAKRLREFNEYLCAGKEWFDPGPRLREHIEKLMAAAGVAA